MKGHGHYLAVAVDLIFFTGLLQFSSIAFVFDAAGSFLGQHLPSLLILRYTTDARAQQQ